MFDEQAFQEALARPRLAKPAPEYLDANRGVEIRAIPDWRYDPLPDQVYVDVQPDGTVRTVIRYIGSGHFSGALRMYPYDESAPTIPVLARGALKRLGR